VVDVSELRQRATADPAAVRADLEASDLSDDPDAQYLLAELTARVGRATEALELTDAAEQAFLAAARPSDARRCDAVASQC
jgi:hypothetical protein